MAKRILIETAHWSSRELGTILSYLLPYARQDSLESLVAQASELIGHSSIYAVSSGRGAMAIALSVLVARAPGKRKILVPEYICPAVPETIRALGLTPIAVETSADLNTSPEAIAQELDESVLASIPVHMYGHLVKARALERAASKAGSFVIDDAAHVIGVNDRQSYHPGTAGAFGFVSFAQSKSIACGQLGSGGLLIVNDASFHAEIEAAVRALPIGRRVNPLSYFISGRRITPGSELLWRWKRFLASGRVSKGNTLATEVTTIPPVYAALALDQFQSLSTRIADKIRIAELFHRHLSRSPSISMPQYAPGRYLTRVMLQVESVAKRDALRTHLLKLGVATRSGYPAPNIPMARGSSPRTFPVFEVPSGYGMQEHEIERVASAISRFLEASLDHELEASHPHRRS